MFFYNTDAFTTPITGSPAILSLKRFARNILKPVSLVMLSLLVFLNVGAHLHAMPLGGSSYTDDMSSLARQSVSSSARALSGHVLSASMTHHHLTSARLSIPTMSDSEATNVADAS